MAEGHGVKTTFLTLWFPRIKERLIIEHAVMRYCREEKPTLMKRAVNETQLLTMKLCLPTQTPFQRHPQ